MTLTLQLPEGHPLLGPYSLTPTTVERVAKKIYVSTETICGIFASRLKHTFASMFEPPSSKVAARWRPSLQVNADTRTRYPDGQ